jgi:radical SAM superfamily enzyme YgiQ (UPF0313 family)
LGKKDSQGKVGYTPLGPLYVTAALEAAGFDVDFRDYQLEAHKVADPMNPAGFLSFLDNSRDIIGIGCNSGTLPTALAALETFKEKHPGKTVILGGIGPTGTAEEIIENFPFIDYVIKGEGEETTVELVKRLKNGKELKYVRGIVYREKGKLRMNPPRHLIAELDSIPLPAYHKIDPRDYSITGITSSRGCPYTCTFCDTSPFWGRKYRRRSVDNVISEILLLRDNYGIRHFEFVDDTFVMSREQVLEFCSRVKQDKLGVQWSCCSHINMMDGEMMKAMAEGGCTTVSYGMESGSDKILKQIRKEFNREQAKKVIAESVKYFDVMISFIWGFPFETMANFNETLECTEYVSRLGATPWLFSLAPLPLSSMYRQYKDALLFPGNGRGGIPGGGEQFTRMLKSYPEIFSGFYRYPTANFEEKYDRVKERGLVEKNNQTVFLDGLLASKWE